MIFQNDQHSPGRKHRGVQLARLAAAGLLLSVSACNSPGKNPLQTWSERDRAVQHAYRAEQPQKLRQVQPLTHNVAAEDEQVVRPQSPEGAVISLPDAFAPEKRALDVPPARTSVVRDGRGNPVVIHEPVARIPLTDPFNPPVALAAYQPSAEYCPPAPANCPTGTCPPMVMMPGGACPLPEYMADEYICDGGDLNLPVHYEGMFRAGLDTEDTVAEFRDEFGKAYVKPSTRICIYAPRFAAVRSSSLPHQDVQIHRAGGHHDAIPPVGVAARLIPETRVKNDELIGLNTRARAGSVEMDEGGGSLTGVLSPDGHVKLLNVFEDRRFQPGGQIDGNIAAIIGLAARNAAEWSQDRVAVVIAKDTSDQIIMGRCYAQDYTAVELRDSAGDLTIVKVADKAAAQPGDVVTFTIRFDNVGGRPLHSVRVVDNLSPRLEYIPGSVQASFDGQVKTEPTSGGSTLLTFEFDQPLEPKTGGTVTFQCRVR